MKYATDNAINLYLRTVQPMYDGVLGEIQKEALAADVPIVPPETARLLSVLLTMQKPKHILEIGTAVGFSAGLMCRYLPEDGTVTTIDRFEVMLKDARKNINKEILKKRIKDLRIENNLTQKELANILNIDSSTISKYEHGINVIATPFLYTICKKYNISADYLLGKIDNPKYLK